MTVYPGEWTRGEIDGPMSPELVLVDPELAAQARGAFAAPESQHRQGPTERPGQSAAYSHLPAPTTVSPSRHRSLLATSLLLALGVGVGFLTARAFSPEPLRGEFVVKQAPSSETGPSSRASESMFPTQRWTTVSTSRAPEPRSFAWMPVPGASSYRVELYLDGELVYRAHTTRPRITAPRSWTHRGPSLTITPGRYWWVVRPSFGS